MTDFAKFVPVIKAILAAQEEIAVRLGDEWPAFKAELANLLQKMEVEEEEEELEYLVDELLYLGLESPAAAIFRQIMRDNGWGEGLEEASRSRGGIESNTHEVISEPTMTSEQFQATVRQAIARWVDPSSSRSPSSKSLGPQPRYLNAGFFEATKAQPVPIKKPLCLDGGPYRLLVNISPTFWGPGAGDRAFPDSHLAEAFRTQESLEVDVVVHSDKIQVTPAQGKLTLPATGESSLIYFDLTLQEEGRQTLSIDLLYHGHLLQSRRMEVEVVAHAEVQLPPSAWPVQDGYITFTRTATLSADDLSALADQPRRLTIVAERDIDYNRIGLHVYDNTGESLHWQTSQLTDNNLSRLIQAVRTQLLAAMKAYAGTIGSNEKVLTKYLGLLATAGRTFYRQLLPNLEQTVLPAGSVIQVAPLSVQLSVPWEVLYERKVFDYREGRTKLCRSFREHGPNECPHANDPLVVCPHGFWGYRYIIEQLPCRVDRQTQTGHNSLPLLIHNKIPLQLSAFVYPHFRLFGQHWGNLQRLGTSNQLKMAQARRFDEIGALLAKENEPDLVYFYAHGGKNKWGAAYLKIGNEQITENDLDAWELDWRASRPLVVLNACDSADYTPDSFANLLHFFWQRGAAGVIATQCEVKEKLADALIIPFLGAFLRQEPAGKALFAARRKLLYERLDPRGLAYSLFAAAEVKLAQPVIDRE